MSIGVLSKNLKLQVLEKFIDILPLPKGPLQEKKSLSKNLKLEMKVDPTPFYITLYYFIFFKTVKSLKEVINRKNNVHTLILEMLLSFYFNLVLPSKMFDQY